MRIAVTGVAGYLGGLLAERLVAEGLGGPDLVGIDLAGPAIPPGRMRYLRRDVRDPRLARDLDGCDTVVHMAFVVETLHDRALVYDVNLGGSRNLLRACEAAGVANVIVASSVAAYGVQGDRVITETTPLLGDAASFYAHTKRLVEDELDVFAARNPRTRLVRVRPSVVLGPRCDTWALEAIGGTGRLDTRRGLCLPLVHEDDVVDGFFRAVTTRFSGPALLAHREPLPGAEAAALLGARRLVVPERVLLAVSDAAYRLRLTRMSRDWTLLAVKNAWRFDPSHTERELGWKPRRSAREALEAALENRRLLGGARARRVDTLEGTRYRLRPAARKEAGA